MRSCNPSDFQYYSFCFLLVLINEFIKVEMKVHLSLCLIKHCTIKTWALRYKPEGCGFDSRWCHWNFWLTLSFRPHYGTGVDSASTRNEYQEYFLGGKGGRCLGLTILPSLCADCLKIWCPQSLESSRPVQACNGIASQYIQYFYVMYLPQV
jgi:hypothetical protein